MPSDYHCSMQWSQGVSTMADIPIALTCADYARLMPLMIGDVKPDGIDLTLIHGTGGAGPARARKRPPPPSRPAAARGHGPEAAPPGAPRTSERTPVVAHA